MPEPTRVYVDSDDGWQELHGISDVRLDATYDPPDWIEGYGHGEIRGVLATLVEETYVPLPIQLALMILLPDLDRCPLYVG